MAPVSIVEDLGAAEDRKPCFVFVLNRWRWTHSFLMVAITDSVTALSCGTPVAAIEARMSESRSVRPNASDRY